LQKSSEENLGDHDKSNQLLFCKELVQRKVYQNKPLEKNVLEDWEPSDLSKDLSAGLGIKSEKFPESFKAEQLLNFDQRISFSNQSIPDNVFQHNLLVKPAGGPGGLPKNSHRLSEIENVNFPVAKSG
jgi:hypothetical protein